MDAFISAFFVLAYLLAFVVCAVVVVCLGAAIRALADWWLERDGRGM